MRVLFYIIIALSVCTPFAYADISNDKVIAYNEAVNAGADLDAIIKASTELAEEAIENADDERATLLAFEAAWMLCQTGNCQQGAKAAQFAASLPALAKGDYPSLETREVLLIPVSQISIQAHREHFLYCSSKGAWRDAAKAAAAAADHAAVFKNELFDEYAFAELTRISSSFNSKQEIELYEDISQLEVDIKETLKALRAARPDANTDIIDTLGYKASAWKGAIGAYFDSIGRQVAIKRIDETFAALNTEEANEAELCPGSFDKPPRVVYPEGAAVRGRVGSVIAGFSVKNGKPVDIKILAAVPEKVFDQTVIESIEPLTWSLAEDADPSNCTPDRENIIFPFVFQF